MGIDTHNTHHRSQIHDSFLLIHIATEDRSIHRNHIHDYCTAISKHLQQVVVAEGGYIESNVGILILILLLYTFQLKHSKKFFYLLNIYKNFLSVLIEHLVHIR